MNRTWSWLALALCAPAFATTALAVAEGEVVKRIPDEYESTGAQGTALGSGGAAALTGRGAVRVNPALLSLRKEYSVSADYHWPTSGREYYQAGVVDSKTSAVAAGVTYTGFLNDYRDPTSDSSASDADSPLVRRGAVALSQPFGGLSLGLGATYAEAHTLLSTEARQEGRERIKGFGLNLGAAGTLSQRIRLGASVENLSNENIRDYVPRTYRAGAAYLFSKQLAFHLDYKQRNRIVDFEAPAAGEKPDENLMDSEEKMVIGSFAARLKQYFRLLGSYSYSLSDERRSVAGGIAVVNRGFTLSYVASRPYMRHPASHQAISLRVGMAM